MRRERILDDLSYTWGNLFSHVNTQFKQSQQNSLKNVLKIVKFKNLVKKSFVIKYFPVTFYIDPILKTTTTTKHFAENLKKQCTLWPFYTEECHGLNNLCFFAHIKYPMLHVNIYNLYILKIHKSNNYFYRRADPTLRSFKGLLTKFVKRPYT